MPEGESLGVLEIALGVDLGELVSGLSKGEQVVAGFTAGVVALAEKAVEAASEAQTAAVQVSGVFGKLSSGVTEFAEAFAKSAGRATSDIQSMVAGFGAMVSPMLKNKEVAAQMSEGLTEMAVNLAKAAHISSDQAMQALQGGLSGHGRELQRLGVSMDQVTMQTQAHHDKLGDVSKLGKAQEEMVAYQVIMQQFAQVQERAAQQSGTFSEQMEELSAATKEASEAFGSDLLPYAAKGLEIINALATGFSNLSPGMRQAIEAFAAFGATIGIVATAEALFNGELAATIVEAATAYAEAAVAALPLIAAVGAAALAVGYLYAEWQKAGLNIREVIAGMIDTLMDALAPAISAIGSAFSTMWEGVKDATAAVRDVIFEMIEGAMTGLSRLLSALAATGHADWAKSAAAGLTSGVSGMESARSGMTAANMGSSISSGASSVWESAKTAASSMGETLEAAGSGFWDKIKEAGGGLSDMVKSAFAGLTGGGHARGAAPKIAPLTQDQISAEATGGQQHGYSGPEATGFSHSALGTEDSAAQAAFTKVNDAITESTTGLLQANKLESAFFQDQSDSIQASKEQLDEATSNQEILGTAMDTFYQTSAQAFAYAASKLQSTILGGLGQVGSAIEAGIQGAQAGGIWGAIIAVFMQLMQACQGFQQVLNVLNSTGDIVANAFSSVFQAILPLVGSIQSLTADVFSGVSKLLQAFSPIFNLLGVLVQDISPIFTSIGNSFQNLGSVLTQIFTALAPLFSMLANVVSALMGVFQSIMQAGQGLFAIIMDVLAPVFKLIGYILQGVGIVIDGIMLGLADAWNGIAAAIAFVGNGIIGVINAIISGINSFLGFMGVNINKMNQLSQQSISIDTSGLQQSLTNMENGNYALTDSQGALIASTDQAAAALTNLPTGYKIALTEFQNMNLGNNAGVTGNTTPGMGNGIPTLNSGSNVSTSTSTTGGTGFGPGTGGSLSQANSLGVGANVGTNEAMDLAQQAYNIAMLQNQGTGAAYNAAYAAAAQAILSANPATPMSTVMQQAAADASAAASTWAQDTTNSSGGSGAQAHAVKRNNGSSSSASSTGSPASAGGSASSTMSGENGEIINVTIQNVTIVSDNPQQIWKQLQKVMRTAAMAKQGRALTNTAGATRYSLPGDGR